MKDCRRIEPGQPSLLWAQASLDNEPGCPILIQLERYELRPPDPFEPAHSPKPASQHRPLNRPLNRLLMYFHVIPPLPLAKLEPVQRRAIAMLAHPYTGTLNNNGHRNGHRAPLEPVSWPVSS